MNAVEVVDAAVEVREAGDWDDEAAEIAEVFELASMGGHHAVQGGEVGGAVRVGRRSGRGGVLFGFKEVEGEKEGLEIAGGIVGGAGEEVPREGGGKGLTGLTGALDGGDEAIEECAIVTLTALGLGDHGVGRTESAVSLEGVDAEAEDDADGGGDVVDQGHEVIGVGAETDVEVQVIGHGGEGDAAIDTELDAEGFPDLGRGEAEGGIAENLTFAGDEEAIPGAWIVDDEEVAALEEERGMKDGMIGGGEGVHGVRSAGLEEGVSFALGSVAGRQAGVGDGAA